MPDHLLFSYGTLQLPQVQRARFGRELSGAPDALPGFRLDTVHITDPDVIADSGTSEHPVAVHTGKDTDEIPGTVLTLTDTELKAADDYEVDDYQRTKVTLHSGQTAWVYTKTNNP